MNFLNPDNLHFFRFEVYFVFGDDHLLADPCTKKPGCSQTRISNFVFASVQFVGLSGVFLLLKLMPHTLVELVFFEEGFFSFGKAGHDFLSDDSHQILVSLDDEYFKLGIVRRGLFLFGFVF